MDIYVLGTEYHWEDNSLETPALLKRRVGYWLRNIMNVILLFHLKGIICDFL